MTQHIEPGDRDAEHTQTHEHGKREQKGRQVENGLNCACTFMQDAFVEEREAEGEKSEGRDAEGEEVIASVVVP